VYVITRWGGWEWGVVVGLGKIGLLIEPCICKANVRAKWWESLFYQSIYRLDPNLSNPRVGVKSTRTR
jgi:hypothetical protein